jgi:hypothetical protein
MCNKKIKMIKVKGMLIPQTFNKENIWMSIDNKGNKSLNQHSLIFNNNSIRMKIFRWQIIVISLLSIKETLTSSNNH